MLAGQGPSNGIRTGFDLSKSRMMPGHVVKPLAKSPERTCLRETVKCYVDGAAAAKGDEVLGAQ